jgi:hypothetical protein
MLQSIITMALSLMTEALKKKKGKVYNFLIDEKTQNTVTDFYNAYVLIVSELEEED